MKRMIVASVALAMLWMAATVGAAEPAPATPPGPGMVAAGKWQLGLAGSFTASERFKDTTEHGLDNTGDSGSEPSRNLKIRDDRMELATLAYGVLPRLTLLAQAGMVEGGKVAETLSNGQWEAKLKPGFVWGVGARGLLWEHPSGLGLTAGLTYLRYDDRKIDYWHATDGWTTNQGNVGVDGKIDYWRLDASLLSHWRLGRYLPFLGLGYAYSQLKDVDTWSRPDGTWTRYDFSSYNQDRWGLLGGVRAELCQNLSLGLNFTFFSREEVGLSLNWSF